MRGEGGAGRGVVRWGKSGVAIGMERGARSVF